MSTSTSKELAISFKSVHKDELVEELKDIIPQLKGICDGSVGGIM